jgi:hypothetical protein
MGYFGDRPQVRNKLPFLFFLWLCVGWASAQSWQKVATENHGNAVWLPAGVTYRVGTAGAWCDSVKTTTATIVQIHHDSVSCKISGIAKTRFTEAIMKDELDVQRQAKPFVIITSLENGEHKVTVNPR